MISESFGPSMAEMWLFYNLQQVMVMSRKDIAFDSVQVYVDMELSGTKKISCYT